MRRWWSRWQSSWYGIYHEGSSPSGELAKTFEAEALAEREEELGGRESVVEGVMLRFFGMPTWCCGISAQGIGTVGCLLNMVSTCVVSRLTPPPPREIQDMVKLVRVPRGAKIASAH